jgi:hypothetical protein
MSSNSNNKKTTCGSRQLPIRYSPDETNNFDLQSIIKNYANAASCPHVNDPKKYTDTALFPEEENDIVIEPINHTFRQSILLPVVKPIIQILITKCGILMNPNIVMRVGHPIIVWNTSNNNNKTVRAMPIALQ